jgi:hypothetical protein
VLTHTNCYDRQPSCPSSSHRLRGVSDRGVRGTASPPNGRPPDTLLLARGMSSRYLSSKTEHRLLPLSRANVERNLRHCEAHRSTCGGYAQQRFVHGNRELAGGGRFGAFSIPPPATPIPPWASSKCDGATKKDAGAAALAAAAADSEFLVINVAPAPSSAAPREGDDEGSDDKGGVPLRGEGGGGASSASSLAASSNDGNVNPTTSDAKEATKKDAGAAALVAAVAVSELLVAAPAPSSTAPREGDDEGSNDEGGVPSRGEGWGGALPVLSPSAASLSNDGNVNLATAEAEEATKNERAGDGAASSSNPSADAIDAGRRAELASSIGRTFFVEGLQFASTPEQLHRFF